MRRLFPVIAVLSLLAGCEGMLGGEEAARIPLQRDATGGYAPVRILLRPEMNPVAFNLHADFAWGRHEEAGSWNHYRVQLLEGGRVLASREFQVNSPERPLASSSAPPATLQQPLLLFDVPAPAEYELVLTTLQPAPVTLDAAHLVLRIRVPRVTRS